MKNNKGFTLVELLAVIVILGVVLSIVVRSVIVSMDNAKKETEKVFISKIEDSIEQYIDLNKRSFVSNGKIGTIRKIVSSDQSIDDEDLPEVDVFEMKHKDGRDFTFNDIINDDTGFIKEKDLVNPANEDIECNKDAIINIYRDTDFVYYYQTDLDCVDMKNENGEDIYDINTLPTLNDENNEEQEESGEEE